MKKLLFFFLTFLFSSTLFAGQIKQIVVLGDSLSDNGNLYQQLKIIPKSPPYFKGRFTNGPTWAEHVGKFFYDKSFIDTKNYAVGGATSILHSPVHDSFIAPITLTSEVYDYFSKSLLVNKKEVLYIIWIGANDYLYEKDPNIDYVASHVVDNISWAVNSLISQGARNFVILNLPDLAKTPYAREHNLIAPLYTIAQLHNKKLAEAMKVLKAKHPESKFVYIDIYSIFNDLLSNPEKFNQQYNQHITDLTNACWKGGMMLQGSDNFTQIKHDLEKAHSDAATSKNFDATLMAQSIANMPSLAEAYSVGKMYEQGMTPCANASEHIFWDEIHPTEAVHQVLAAIVEKEMSGFNI